MGSRGAARRGPQPGAHLKYTLTLSFEEAVFGIEKELDIPRLETCPTCQGSGAEPGTTPVRCPAVSRQRRIRRVQQSIFGSFVNVGTCARCEGEGEVVSTPCSNCRGQKRVQVTRKIKVNIPPGVDDGTQIRLSSEGEAGLRGGPAGNLYVVVSVRKHAMFEREGNNLLLTLPIDMVQAALGEEITVPSLDGEVKLTIPPGHSTAAPFASKNTGCRSCGGAAAAICS